MLYYFHFVSLCWCRGRHAEFCYLVLCSTGQDDNEESSLLGCGCFLQDDNGSLSYYSVSDRKLFILYGLCYSSSSIPWKCECIKCRYCCCIYLQPGVFSEVGEHRTLNNREEVSEARCLGGSNSILHT